MSKSNKHYRLTDRLWMLDSYVGSSLFETGQALRRWTSAYSSFLYRWRPQGLSRLLVWLMDDGLTLGGILAFAVIAYALPPFSGTGDIWNRGREFAVTFTDSDGTVVGQRGIRQNDAINLDDIPPHVIKAVLATEDARFFDHFGVDVIGTLRAVVQNSRANGVVQGGSSITQQVAKNLFLSPERTIQRKVHEAFLSLWIEARLSKPEILKLYLDRSYLGGGNYGIEAASQFYFGKSVRDISLSEAAMLAGLFKAPTKYAPHQNPDAARARSDVVLYRMVDAGFITQGELLKARREPAMIVAQTNKDSPDWFLDQAYRETLAILDANGLNKDFVIEVKTTLDSKLQAASQKIINDVVDTKGPELKFTQAAAVTMRPDGAIKSIVGGRDYASNQFNRATVASRQTGSAFKPFVYLAALENGFTPDTMVVDGPVSVGNWSPRNYMEKYGGRTTLTNALAHSYNSIPVKLMQAIGRPAIIQTARAVGIEGALDNWAPMVLGTSSLTLLDLTRGYATFAGGGKLSDPHTVVEIKRPNGDVIYDRSAFDVEAPQVAPTDKVAELNFMLKAVVKAGTARAADLGYAPQGGKTGTNQSYRDAWFVGFTAHNVTGVWVGNDDFAPMEKVTGGMVPAPAWKRIMNVAERGETPVGLAGIPLDNTYIAVADAQTEDTALVQTAAAETEGQIQDDASAGPQAVEVASTETPSADPSQDPNNPLNTLFPLFEKKTEAPEQVAAVQKPAPRLKTARARPVQIDGNTLYGSDGYNDGRQDGLLELPRANASRRSSGSFLNNLLGFNSDDRPKRRRRHRTLMDVYNGNDGN